MATKHEQRRAKKQAARKKNSKDKQRKERVARQTATAMFNKDHPKASHKSVYDLIEEGARIKRKQNLGEDVPVSITGKELIQGISDTISVSVKAHSGLIVYMKMIEEGRFALTPEAQTLQETYEKALVLFAEDVNVVITLHEAKHEPEEYTDILLHIVDTMNTLVTLSQDVITLAESQREIIETYVQEHKPAELDMISYMSQLHEERMNVVRPLYATSISQELLNDFQSMLNLTQSVDDMENVADPENLPAPAGEDGGEVGELVAPNDPVSQASA